MWFCCEIQLKNNMYKIGCQTMFKPKLMLLTISALMVTANVLAKHQDPSKIEPRIINGKDAISGQFPYYVFLDVRTSVGETVCGGSLISSEWILTAGHCLEDVTSIRAFLGSLRVFNKIEMGRQFIKVGAKELHIHPGFSSKFTAK